MRHSRRRVCARTVPAGPHAPSGPGAGRPHEACRGSHARPCGGAQRPLHAHLAPLRPRGSAGSGWVRDLFTGVPAEARTTRLRKSACPALWVAAVRARRRGQGSVPAVVRRRSCAGPLTGALRHARWLSGALGEGGESAAPWRAKPRVVHTSTAHTRGLSSIRPRRAPRDALSGPHARDYYFGEPQQAHSSCR
jgi:hypothetical protein